MTPNASPPEAPRGADVILIGAVPTPVQLRTTAHLQSEARAPNASGSGTNVTFGTAVRCDFTTGPEPLFAERLHALSADGLVDAATQMTFEWTEQYLSSRRFREVDAILNALEPERLLPEVIIAILALTRFEQGEIPCRASFLARAEVSLRNRLGPERAERLLASRR